MKIFEEATAVVYQSDVEVEAKPGAIKLVHLPMEAEPVPMGIHGAIAEHYKVPEGSYEPHAATLDYIVGATTACLTGTLTRALAAKKIPTLGGRLKVAGRGLIEAEDGVLVIRSIEVTAHLRAEASRLDDAEQVIAHYAAHCPVYRSLYKSIAITTTLDFEPEQMG